MCFRESSVLLNDENTDALSYFRYAYEDTTQ